MAEYICGKNSVMEALRSARTVNRVYLADKLNPAEQAKIRALCKEKGVPCDLLDRAALARLAGPENRGVAAEVSDFVYAEPEELLAAAAAKGEAPLLIIAAELNDPHNLGAILRTAECAGAHGLIIPKRRGVQVTETVCRVSAGAASYLPVARVGNLVSCVESLKQAGVWICGADMAGAQSLWEADLSGPLAIVVGSEGEGIPRLLREHCDFLVRIPMCGRVNSLNASNAAAVLIYEVLRQRKAAKG